MSRLLYWSVPFILTGLFSWCGLLSAADVKLEGPSKAPQYTLVRVKATSDGSAFIWDSVPRLPSASSWKSGGLFVFTGPPGKYEITVRAVKVVDPKTLAIEISEASLEVTIEGTVPVPPAPVPPGPLPPGPTPTPPGPTPTPPSPAPVDPPIEGAGLRILIVEESADRTKLPLPQQLIILGQPVRDYLNANTVLGADGKRHEWNIWDKDADASKQPKRWSDALARANAKAKAKAAGGKYPWVLISNGKTGYEGPLQDNVDKFMEEVNKVKAAATTKSIERKGR